MVQSLGYSRIGHDLLATKMGGSMQHFSVCAKPQIQPEFAAIFLATCERYHVGSADSKETEARSFQGCSES